MIPGLKIGHHTLPEASTGISVFLFPFRAKAHFFICGTSPATRDIAIIEEGRLGLIDALVFTGGSAYGLGATNGVMEWLKNRDLGYRPMPDVIVPMVPAAAIFDDSVKKSLYPTAKEAYVACESATENNLLSGKIGAGAGAKIGKWLTVDNAEEGGLGVATICQGSLIVQSYVVVNSIGNIVDRKGTIVAGDRTLSAVDKNFPDIARAPQPALQNTTLAAIFTNAKLDRHQLYLLAKMASAGIARTVYPAFTAYDGDIVFTVSLGEETQASLSLIGHLAALATEQAILNAVKTDSRC